MGGGKEGSIIRSKGRLDIIKEGSGGSEMEEVV
jgi:hypothetical protein